MTRLAFAVLLGVGIGAYVGAAAAWYFATAQAKEEPWTEPEDGVQPAEDLNAIIARAMEERHAWN